MTPDMLALGKRAVACRGWRWLPGMSMVPRDKWPDGHTRIDTRIIAVDPRPGTGPWGSRGYYDMDGWLPDFTDPCTLGGLLALAFDGAGPDVQKWVARVIILGGFPSPEVARCLVEVLEAAP